VGPDLGTLKSSRWRGRGFPYLCLSEIFFEGAPADPATGIKIAPAPRERSKGPTNVPGGDHHQAPRKQASDSRTIKLARVRFPIEGAKCKSAPGFGPAPAERPCNGTFGTVPAPGGRTSKRVSARWQRSAKPRTPVQICPPPSEAADGAGLGGKGP
jgi:hypothetical protein